MKAKKVYESVSFQRGSDPKTSLGVGIAYKMQEFYDYIYDRTPPDYQDGVSPIEDLSFSVVYGKARYTISYRPLEGSIHTFEITYEYYANIGWIGQESRRFTTLDELKAILKGRYGLPLSENLNTPGFVRGADPRDTMEIGQLSQIKKNLLADDHEWKGIDDALLWSAKNGREDYVRFLLSAGADPNTKDNFAGTALMWASEHDHKEIVPILLDAGADINARDDYGGTALIWASENGRKEPVQMLIDAGADINARDDYGGTSLVWASGNGHKETVQALLDAGADPNTKDNFDGTALIKASYAGNIEVIKLLKKYGATE